MTICDVGGGTGHVPLALLRAFPEHNFKAVIHDVPTQLEEGMKVGLTLLVPRNILDVLQHWEATFPEALRSDKVDFVPLDFLKETPTPGCDFYYVSAN